MVIKGWRVSPVQLAAVLFLTLVVVLGALGFMSFFNTLPLRSTTLALDWRNLWQAFNAGLQYDAGVGALRNPPWSVLPLWPLGALPMASAWGLLVYASLIVLVLSVPRVRPRWRTWAGILLLVASFPSLRNIADGNFEALVIAGVLLTLAGYERQQPLTLSVGVLLASAKPQTVLLLMPVLALYVLQTWPLRAWLRAGLITGSVILVTFLWRGEQWLASLARMPQLGTVMEANLMASLTRLDALPEAFNWALWLFVLAVTLLVVWRGNRHLSREKSGLLIAASLLLSPYAAGTLVPLAIGVIALFVKRPAWGLPLIVLIDVQLWLNQPQFVAIFAYYSTFTLVAMWAVLAVFVWREELITTQQSRFEDELRDLD